MAGQLESDHKRALCPAGPSLPLCLSPLLLLRTYLVGIWASRVPRGERWKTRTLRSEKRTLRTACPGPWGTTINARLRRSVASPLLTLDIGSSIAPQRPAPPHPRPAFVEWVLAIQASSSGPLSRQGSPRLSPPEIAVLWHYAVAFPDIQRQK